MEKEVREIAAKLESQGWSIDYTKKHPLAKSPDGRTIVPLPTTPGGGRWRQNLTHSFGEEVSIPTHEPHEIRFDAGERIEWTFAAETIGGATDSEAALERFAEFLYNSPHALGAAASLDAGEGVLSAIFQVDADDVSAAFEVGVGVFIDALRAAEVVPAGFAATAQEAVPQDELMRALIARTEAARTLVAA